ncbi:hypothetical protein [Nocardiopsis synnemataformans]|uniref:hypothetical protein n=1 Tax=Nocardiopsis synnemataformans TaxID=61305 RepID=UPI003EB81651
MSSFALLDATVWVGGYDFTGHSNSVSLTTEVEELDVTPFGAGGWRKRIGGLRSASSETAGFWEAAPDEQMFTNLSQTGLAATFSPTGDEGGVAYFYQGAEFSYEAFGAVGEACPFSMALSGSEGHSGLVRGRLLASTTTVDATGQLGSIVQAGAVDDGQYLYAALHTFAAGTTITVTVESDDTVGFADPTTRATLGPVSAVGGTWAARVAGPITDTYWRLNVSAITGEHTVAGVIGIQ